MKTPRNVGLLLVMVTLFFVPVPGGNLVGAAELSLDEKTKLDNLVEFTNVPFKRLRHSLQSVEKVLGNPRKAEVSATVNRHDPAVTDKIYVLNYDGASVEIYDATLNRQFLVFSSLERDLPLLGLSIRMGASLSTIKSLFGHPDKESNEALEYTSAYENDTAVYRVIFHFKESKLIRIDWRLRLD